MQLAQDRRGKYLNTEYLNSGANTVDNRAILKYEIPLSLIIVDFYDQLKSVTAGYASLNYEFLKYQKADVVKMTMFIAEDPVESLSVMVNKDKAMREGKRIVKKLKELIPRQMFVVKIQALIGGKIVAAERISAMRKDVTAKLYGGDISRKLKVLKRQKEAKKRMAQFCKVKLPQSVYLSLLKRD
jgi:GTP-binding protein LepA